MASSIVRTYSVFSSLFLNPNFDELVWALFSALCPTDLNAVSRCCRMAYAAVSDYQKRVCAISSLFPRESSDVFAKLLELIAFLIHSFLG
jgi:hypothetical protein